MKLSILGSSSAGNCYVLHNEHEALIIEAGMPFADVRKALNFKTSIITGLILTHEHGDHAKHVLQYAENGICCYMSSGTRRNLKSSSHRYHSIKEKELTNVGNFEIVPFDIEHDCAEPFGFIIQHKDCGRVVFLTDTHFCKYKFQDVNHYLVEANYSQEIINSRVYSGESKAFLRDRVIQSHMSLDTCLDMLEANDLTQTQNIVLLHLSDRNSNAEDFKRIAENRTGKQVFVAAAGVQINLSKTLF